MNLPDLNRFFGRHESWFISLYNGWGWNYQNKCYHYTNLFEEVSNCFPERLHHFPFPEAICKTSHFPMLFNAKQNILITAILEGINLHPLMLVWLHVCLWWAHKIWSRLVMYLWLLRLQPPKCWGCRYEPPHLVHFNFELKSLMLMMLSIFPLPVQLHSLLGKWQFKSVFLLSVGFFMSKL